MSVTANSYNGDKPYIFISYAHKDAERVIPAIEAMQQQGYRVWYDRGIEAGTEWSNNIASHLHSCAVFIAFISENSMNSENCLDEIAYAKSHRKPSLMIFLEEDVILPQGTDMQTARFQRMYFNRQTSTEDFLNNLKSTSIFDPCIEPPSADESEPSAPKPAPAPTPAPAPAAEKSGKKGMVIGGIVGAVAILAVLAVVLVVLFGGKDSQGNDAPATSTPVNVTMSDDLNDYTFTLEGEVYQLPFAFSRLTDNGWTITSSGYSSSTQLPGMSKDSFSMAKDGKKIYVSAYNDTGNVITVADSKIGGIEVEAGSGADFVIAKGITPSSTVDEIKAAFGAPNSHNTQDDYENLFYGQEQYSNAGVTFFCYNAASNMQKYSSIELENFVAQSETETSDEVPAYLSAYKAPSALSKDPLVGAVKIDSELYQLPAPLQVFLDNGWALSTRPAYVVAGGKESITLARDGKKLYIDITNFADYQTIPENCAVTSLTVYDTSKVEAYFSTDISIGMTLAALEKVVPSSMERSDGTYSTTFRYSEYDDRNFSLTVTVDNESGVVETICLRCGDWGY